MAEQLELHVYPCADTLLYAPVYLAIELIGIGPEYSGWMLKSGIPLERGWRQGSDGSCVWELVSNDKRQELRLELHPPANGDVQAIGYLGTRAGVHTIALADPMRAVLDESGQHVVVATFINRIALSAVYSLSTNAKKKGLLKGIQDSIRETGRFLGREDFERFCHLLEISFCTDASTNRALLHHFLGVDQSCCPVTLGADEVAVVALGKSDVGFTSAPWLRHARELVPPDVRWRRLEANEWLPSVPYPFSGVVASAETWRWERESKWRGPLSLLLRHLVIASAVLCRYREAAAYFLSSQAHRFRNFGIPGSVKSDFDTVILSAVRHIAERDYLAEDPANTWIAWDLATDATQQAALPFALYDRFLARTEGHNEKSFWGLLQSNGPFWNTNFRGSIASFMGLPDLRRFNRLVRKYDLNAPCQ